jgi:hypothetical protein
MKKTHLLTLLPLAASLLAGCGTTVPASSSTQAVSSTGASSGAKSSETSSAASSVDDFKVKWVSPVGAPALAFYDQGTNTNWVSSSSPQTQVVPAFATNDNAAVVFDGVSGLNLIKNKNYNYKLAQWISGGNFYVVSTKYSDKTSLTSGMKIDAFVKSGNASQSFLKLSKEKWGWSYLDSDITFENGVADVKDHLVAAPEAFDYYVVAEPVKTAATKALKAKGVTLNTISNLQDDWKTAYQTGTIPAAAIFVNTTQYAAHSGAIDIFLKETQTRQNTAVNTPASVKTALDAYGDDTAVTARFGFTSGLVSALQTNNLFGIFKEGDVSDKKALANDYAVTLGQSAFADNLFL